ncbi:helix-turn-helix transcriptional regulator [Mucilaginibacter sp. ZT4R22]|uniref:Helix-turn-helix transcriptional regulator n=1 Tax=Mucilaginibacter pankratovii TaxID=2772110 RepID=A0ABR7WXD4_9SPHI|nr:helix-turn-helix transcriptional regulator [Mucilaginibacter pankratovii]MBD1366945.1 helix-turn-helix transcriptional regulator [Mucilaginibacter pankratovii]
MIFYIKNMVCMSCQVVVKYELEKLGLTQHKVEQGNVEIFEPISAEQILEFKLALIRSGMELMDNKKNLLVEKIVYVITEMIDYGQNELKTNFSYHLSEKLNHDYTYLANIFSEAKGTTIEQFIILKKIQRVKQLICDKELNLTEISWKMHYSSVAHLSTQFKKITGVTPSHFKQSGCNSETLPQMCEL